MHKELTEIPSFSAPFNNLGNFITRQKLDLYNAFRTAIASDDINQLQTFFINQASFEQFKTQYQTFEVKAKLYRNNKKKDDIDWPKSNSSIQTFAYLNSSKKYDVLFQLQYSYTQVATKLWVNKVIYIPSNKVKNKEKILLDLNDTDKPAPPIPEENKVVN